MTSEWIAAAAAVAAAIVGPLSSVIVASRQNRAAAMVARRQISASLISGNRQAWINNLRDAIAEFQAVLYQLGFRGAHSYDRAKDDEWTQKAMHLRSRVALFINPVEAVHGELLLQMDHALSVAYSSGEAGRQEMTKVQSAITETAQRLLKQEWERVKIGEPDELLEAERKLVAKRAQARSSTSN